MIINKETLDILSEVQDTRAELQSEMQESFNEIQNVIRKIAGENDVDLNNVSSIKIKIPSSFPNGQFNSASNMQDGIPNSKINLQDPEGMRSTMKGLGESMEKIRINAKDAETRNMMKDLGQTLEEIQMESDQPQKQTWIGDHSTQFGFSNALGNTGLNLLVRPKKASGKKVDVVSGNTKTSTTNKSNTNMKSDTDALERVRKLWIGGERRRIESEVEKSKKKEESAEDTQKDMQKRETKELDLIQKSVDELVGMVNEGNLAKVTPAKFAKVEESYDQLIKIQRTKLTLLSEVNKGEGANGIKVVGGANGKVVSGAKKLQTNSTTVVNTDVSVNSKNDIQALIEIYSDRRKKLADIRMKWKLWKAGKLESFGAVYNPEGAPQDFENNFKGEGKSLVQNNDAGKKSSQKKTDRNKEEVKEEIDSTKPAVDFEKEVSTKKKDNFDLKIWFLGFALRKAAKEETKRFGKWKENWVTDKTHKMQKKEQDKEKKKAREKKQKERAKAEKEEENQIKAEEARMKAVKLEEQREQQRLKAAVKAEEEKNHKEKKRLELELKRLEELKQKERKRLELVEAERKQKLLEEQQRKEEQRKLMLEADQKRRDEEKRVKEQAAKEAREAAARAAKQTKLQEGKQLKEKLLQEDEERKRVQQVEEKARKVKLLEEKREQEKRRQQELIAQRRAAQEMVATQIMDGEVEVVFKDEIRKVAEEALKEEEEEQKKIRDAAERLARLALLQEKRDREEADKRNEEKRK
jgi:hypothetical protein